MSSSAPGGAIPRWPRPSEWPVWAVPLFIALVQVVGSSGANWRANFHHHVPVHRLDGFGFLLLLAGPALLLARRRHPVPVLVAVNLTTLLFVLRGYPTGPAFLGLTAAVVAAVTAGHRLAAWLIGAGTYGAFFGATALLHIFDVRAFPSYRLTVPLAVTVLAWALVVLIGAEFIRIRAERMAEERHTRAEEERRRASEERLRIARELHDVLAHNISMINVQAGVALHLMDERPEQARTALAAIKDASKEALTEMRSVIDVLRQGDEAAPRAPTAGLDRLDDLVARARSAGLRVTCSVTGRRRPLPGGVDLAAFRIVQEALTNVTRHAGAGEHDGVTASIQVTYLERDVVVQVDDDGRGGGAAAPAERPGGSGIPGMRERAAALGGEFTAGPRPGGGFRVRARLPVPDVQMPVGP
ncbi:MAG TPA: histidine kinase [Streptosporangiaceae bacterium]